MAAARDVAPRAGRPEAAAAIWRWREAEPAAPAEAPAERARLRGLVQGAVAAAAGGAAIAFGWPRAGSVALGLGALVALAALASPRGLFAGIERVAAATGRVVGRGLTRVLMPLLFYGVFTPFALLFRRGRRDAMTRFTEPAAASYWSPRTRGRSASASRRRQY